jgi:hypothetical protein
MGFYRAGKRTLVVRNCIIEIVRRNRRFRLLIGKVEVGLVCGLIAVLYLVGTRDQRQTSKACFVLVDLGGKHLGRSFMRTDPKRGLL